MKKFLAVLMVMCLMGIQFIGTTVFAATNATLFLTTDNFEKNLGTWVVNTEDPTTVDGKCLLGMNDLAGVKTAIPASAAIKIPVDGTYYVWARAKDYTDKPGTRIFNLEIGGVKLPNTLGGLNYSGFAWELAGKIDLKAGVTVLNVVDTGKFYGRCDAIVVTTKKDFIGPDKAASIKSELGKYKVPVEESAKLPGVTATPTPTPTPVSTLAPTPVPTATPTPKPTSIPNAQRPSDEIAVKFNGQYLKFDVSPVMENDRILVPMRVIFEALKCSVSWDDKSQTATGVRDGKTVTVTIGSSDATIDGAIHKIDQSAVLKGDRTLVPLRFVSEAFDAKVEWQEDTKTVIITVAVPTP